MKLLAEKTLIEQGPYKGYQQTVFYKRDGGLYAIFPTHLKQPNRNQRWITLNGWEHRITWKDKELKKVKACKPFTYNRMLFTPLRNLTAAEKRAVYNCDDEIWLYPALMENFNYNEFYLAAGKAGARGIDLFLWEGKEVVPLNDSLMEFIVNPQK
jgi:hypothetical protein